MLSLVISVLAIILGLASCALSLVNIKRNRERRAFKEEIHNDRIKNLKKEEGG